ncbi:glutathione peroxidase [Ruegeria pomeroyi]|uniref:Glutathione peroxidase n=1 Tax=Ruegeria alba TaxID=2916756 RepID=A0ABS9NYX1_9RHOB|nr:glutathione peroxidase [Ruegeria alba]MCE8513812.1 glutathione peroxidase [Ruegeria pomeroyi]MCE8530590.1 glutathione peroxidase [Ruegeria pomeroyi]MCE8544546.1 glutathione peroxidase [Ruegeria pomeroyi]MCG6559411.1 glutathione peroxidase [Ruegeria alba]
MYRIVFLIFLLLVGRSVQAGPVSGVFPSIDGGSLSMEDWRGRPVLVVNTASQCGFTGQYAGLQKLWETYQDAGLVVLAIPSDDFNQELTTAAEVKEFCALNYDLTLPMTDILHVKGTQAHPFYKAVKAETGFEPAWNFNKVLVAPDGSVAATFGSAVKPHSARMQREIEALLN